MSWFKKLVHGAENIFKKQMGVGNQGVSNASAPPATDLSPAQQQEQMGGAATSNAGDAVVNYQTKGKAGLQPTGQAPKGT